MAGAGADAEPPVASVLAAALAGPADLQLQGSLRRLRDSLRGFHDDLKGLYAARRRHNTHSGAHRRALLRAAARPHEGGQPAVPKAQPEHQAPRDLWGAVAGGVQKHTAPEKLAAALPAAALEAERPAEPGSEERRTVGITGIGRLAGDSPESKGARRRDVGVEKLGGEQALRELLVRYVEGQAQGKVPGMTRDSIQDIWADQVSADLARVSALYVCGHGDGRSESNIDCRQFSLSRDAEGSWRVDSLLKPEPATGDRPDECEVSQSVDFPSPEAVHERREVFRKGEAKASSSPDKGSASPDKGSSSPDKASSPSKRKVPAALDTLAGDEPATSTEARLTPKRKAPPPLTEIAGEDASGGAAGEEADGEGGGESESLAEAVRFGLGVAEGSRTPKQVFQSFAAPGGTSSVIHLQKFASLVAAYGGRSPAAQGGEGLSCDLFEELAVGPSGGERGVPYDLFCAELCPEKAPDAVLRVKGKRVALLRDLRAAVVSQFGSSPTGHSMEHRMKGLLELLGKSPWQPSEGAAPEHLQDTDFESAVARVLGSPPAPAPDQVAVKALWCDLVRGKKGRSRRLDPEALCKVLLEPEGGGMTPLGGATLSRLSPCARSSAKPLDEGLIEEGQGDSGAAAAALQLRPAGGTLLDALRFGIAADGRSPRELFVSMVGDGSADRPVQPLSREEFVAFAAKFGGGIPIEAAEDSTSAGASSTDAEAVALFEDLALVNVIGQGLRLPYELFVAEVCADRAPDDAAKIAKRRTALFRDLQTAVRSGTVHTQARVPPALSAPIPLDEAAFGKAVHELLESPPSAAPDPIAVKALWCQLVRGRKNLERQIAPKELLALLNSSAASPSASAIRGLQHHGSLELSDDENSELELSLSQSVPGPDATIEDVTPFATPTGARPFAKSSGDNGVSFVPMKEGDLEQTPKMDGKAEPMSMPTIEVTPPEGVGPPAGLLASALLKAAAEEPKDEGGFVIETPASSPSKTPFASEAPLRSALDDVPLKVTIVSARGLRNSDWLPGSGVSDPYCTCEIRGKPNSKFQTLVADNDLNPVWNREEVVEDYEVGDSLTFTVFDQDFVGKCDLLGRVTLKKEQFHPDGFEGELRLEEAGKGIEAYLKVKVSPAAKVASPPTSDVGADETAVERPRDFWGAVAGDIKKHTLAQELGVAKEQATKEQKEAEEDPTKERLLPEKPAQQAPVSPAGVKAATAAAEPAPDRFFQGAAAAKSPDAAASAYASAVASSAMAAAVAEAATTGSSQVQAKPGDAILGDYDREDIRARSKERLEKQAEKELLEQARSALAGAALDGRLAQAVAGEEAEDVPPSLTPAKQRKDEELAASDESVAHPSLARPGAAKVQPLGELETRGEAEPSIERAISPASASAVESAVTPLGESIAGLLHLSAGDLVSPSNLSLTGASSRMSPKMPTSPSVPSEEKKTADAKLKEPSMPDKPPPPSPSSVRRHSLSSVEEEKLATRSHTQHLVRHSTGRSSLFDGPHEVKLYQVRKIKGEVVERVVPLERESLNEGDCFVLDTEDKIYVWHGKTSQPLEKYQATTLADLLLHERSQVGSKIRLPQVTLEIDAGFWEPLGGEGYVKGPNEVTDSPPTSPKVSAAKAESKPKEAPAADVPAPVVRKKFTGKSPFMSKKEMERVFSEADTDGDGVLSLEELLSYLGDYLRYGDAEIRAFHAAHGATGGGPTLDLLKSHYGELDPYNPYKKSDRLIVRKPGAFGGMKGVDCRMEECRNCTILVCDRPEEVYADELVNCRVLVGPCGSSTFFRNCSGCDFWICARQLRVRECTNCRFYLYSFTEPVIEMSSDLSFAPFSAEYPGLSEHFQAAGFDPSRNRWSAIYDFSGRADGANWRIQPLDECETLVVSFRRDPEKPDSPCPPITQELLTAPPPPSEESAGSSMANTPQTRPPPPPPVEACHPISGKLMDKPRRHLMDDREDAARDGHEEIDGVMHPWKPLPPVTRTALDHPSEPSRSAKAASEESGPAGKTAVATGRVGRAFQRGRGSADSSDSSDGDAVRPSPLGRGRNMQASAKAVARGAAPAESDSDSDDGPPAAKARALLGSAMASRAAQQLMRRAMDDDSD